MHPLVLQRNNSPAGVIHYIHCDIGDYPAKRQLKLFGAPSSELPDIAKREIDNSLVKMIGVDYQPLSIVEETDIPMPKMGH